MVRNPNQKGAIQVEPTRWLRSVPSDNILGMTDASLWLHRITGLPQHSTVRSRISNREHRPQYPLVFIDELHETRVGIPFA